MIFSLVMTVIALSGWVMFFTVIKSNTDLRGELARKNQEISALSFQLQNRISDLKQWKQMYYMTNTKPPKEKGSQ